MKDFILRHVQLIPEPLLDGSELLLHLALYLHYVFQFFYLLFQLKDDRIVVFNSLLMKR